MALATFGTPDQLWAQSGWNAFTAFFMSVLLGLILQRLLRVGRGLYVGLVLTLFSAWMFFSLNEQRLRFYAIESNEQGVQLEFLYPESKTQILAWSEVLSVHWDVQKVQGAAPRCFIALELPDVTYRSQVVNDCEYVRSVAEGVQRLEASRFSL